MQPGSISPRTKIGVERPADFESYWRDVVAAASAVPLDATLTPLPDRSTPDVDVYELHYTSIDNLRIAGWYCTPNQERVAGPYPGLVISPGYISEPLIPKSWARRGYAALALAPRGKLRSNARFNPGYPGLLVHNIVDRDTYSYRGFYMDAYRGLDALLGRPEVDPARIAVYGSSQGGALSIVLAALRSDVVKVAVAGAPYLCGIRDAARLTHSYPYEEINEYLRAHPDHEQRLEETVAYFDGLNFASAISCPILVHLGTADDVCPPETGLALYDRLDAPKRLVVSDGSGHDAGAHWLGDEVARFLADGSQGER